MQVSPSLAQILTNLNLPPYPTVTGLPQPITWRSLASFAGALGWAWLLLVSFTGWGRVAGRLLRAPRLPASVACSLGIAAIVFLGGWLNLAHGIYPGVLFAITAIGLLFYLLTRNQRPEEYSWLQFWSNASRASKMLLLLTLAILILRVAGTVRLGMFNNLDDNAAYMVFPHKMLATHSFANDPFSDRRIISSLGGSYLLQAFIIAATSLTHIAMADRTLGLMLLGGILFDFGIAFNLSVFQIALLESLAYLTPIETINLTFTILPASLLLAMAWLLWRSSQQKITLVWSDACLAGAIGGAAIAMKSTYLPIIGALLFIPFWMRLNEKPAKAAIQIFFVTALGTLLVVLAWMIAMKQTSGTYLFPVLGHGVDYSSYGIVAAKQTFHSSRSFLKIFLQGAALLVFAGIQFFFGRKDRRLRFSTGILIAAAVAITAFNYRSGGDFIWRYNFPQFFSAIIIAYLAGAGVFNSLNNPDRRARRVYFVGVLALVGMLVYYDGSGQHPRPFREMAMEWGDYRIGLHASLTGLELASPAIRAEYSAAEMALTTNGTALENTAYPFLFDFARHKILITDWPGAASPTESWPLRGSSSQAGEFLVNHSVRYLMYDYGYARWEDTQACQALESPLRNSEELSVLWQMTVIVHHQFDSLRSTHASAYDDGKMAVIDLERPRQDASSPLTDWTLDTSKEQICSAVLARYLANPLPQSSK
jgi:hypothetical protein